MPSAAPDPDTHGVDTHGIAPDVYRRRWLILAILNLSLVTIVMAVSAAQRGVADDPTRSRRVRHRAAVDRRRLHARVRRVAAARGSARRSVRPEGRAPGRARDLRCRLFAASQASDPGQLIALRTVMGVGAAFIMPATLSIILNSFPIQERPKAIAIWATSRGSWRRTRPHHERPAARALLVGLGVHGDAADRGRTALAHRAVRADLAATRVALRSTRSEAFSPSWRSSVSCSR